ncbi:MAG: replication/maintenance protein RepL [bacterium]|nr:replication/maintenance protein RepL [bacterium]
MANTDKRTTSKKVKVIGKEQYINSSTGEVEDFQVVSLQDRDFNFHKIWLAHIINSLDLIGNQKTKLAFWILDNLDKENQLIMPYRQIAKKTGISLDTVSKTMSALISCDFLQKINNGAYRVNPDVIFKGSNSARMNVLYKYQDTRIENTKPDNRPDEVILEEQVNEQLAESEGYDVYGV